MKIDWNKFGIWIVVIIAVFSAFLFRQERKHRVATPPVVVTDTVTVPLPPETAPPPEVAPVIVTPSVPAPKAPKHAVKPKPPAPAPVVKPPVRVKTKCDPCGKKAAAKKRSHRVDCSLVPHQAYEYPQAMVVAAAEQRGVDAAGITVLKACIAKHGAR